MAEPQNSTYPGVTSQDAKLITSLLVDLGLFAVLMSFFLFMKKRVPRVYEARTFDKHAAVDTPSGGWIGWIKSALDHDDLWMLRNRGLDAVIYLRVLRTLIEILIPCTLLGLVVLMPIYGAAGGNDLLGLESLTLNNLVEGSSFVWAAFTMVCVYSLWSIFCLYRMYYRIVGLRIYYRSLRRVENYVALVREIPRNLSAKEVAAHFDNLFPGEIVAINVALKSSKLPKLFKARQNAVFEMEKFSALYYETGERKRIYKHCPWDFTLVKVFCCCASRSVDGLNYWTERYNELDQEIREKQTKPRGGAGCAFITFRTIRSAQMLWQSALHSGNFGRDEKDLLRLVPRPWISEAPAPPESVIYENLAVSEKNRFWRLVVVDIINLILVVAFYVPVAVLVAIANAETEEINRIPIIGALVIQIPAIEGLVRGFLPSLGLSIVNVLQLVVLRLLISQVGYLDYGSYHKSILGRYFLFFIGNNLIGITFGGAVIDVFQVLLVEGRTLSALELLADAIPRQATFFQNYLLILGLAGNAFFLAMPLITIFRWIGLSCCAYSRRQKRNWNGPWRFPFEGAIWPLVVFLFGMVYSVISPLILVFALFYMCFAYVRGKYDFTYVYTSHHPSNGYIFSTFYTCTMWSVILFQAITMCVLLLQGSYYAFFLLIIIFLSICVFILVQLKFSNLARHGTLSQKPESEGAICPPDCYVQPFFLKPSVHFETQDPNKPEEIFDERDQTFSEWESQLFKHPPAKALDDPLLLKVIKNELEKDGEEEDDETQDLLFQEAGEEDSDLLSILGGAGGASASSKKTINPLRDTQVVVRPGGLIEDVSSARMQPVHRDEVPTRTVRKTTRQPSVSDMPTTPRTRKVTSHFIVNRTATAIPGTMTEFEDFSRQSKSGRSHRRGGSYFNSASTIGVELRDAIEGMQPVEEMEPVEMESVEEMEPAGEMEPVDVHDNEPTKNSGGWPEDASDFSTDDIEQYIEHML